jgi:hypothetical protein
MNENMFLEKTEEIRANYAKYSEMLTQYKQDVVKLYPDFLEVHWLRRMFFRKLPKEFQQTELEIFRILFQNKFYFEALEFVHLYKNPIWFMSMHLTLFASHMLWVLFFILNMLIFLYIQQIKKRTLEYKIMKVDVKMEDVKVKKINFRE